MPVAPSAARYTPLHKPTPWAGRLPRPLRPLYKLLLILSRLLYRYRLPFALLLTIPPTLISLLLLASANTPALVPAAIREAHRPLLVVAHPDDECLFFSPAVLGAIKAGSKPVDAAILVLSNGGNYGIGDVRAGELRGSCAELGVREERCTVMDLAELKDNPREWWPAEKVAEVVKKHAEEVQADVIITFDSGGVSGHLNHRSVHRGLQHLTRSYPATTPPIFSSTTVFLLRKYSSIWDVTLTALPFLPNLIFSPHSENEDRALFFATWSDYRAARRAFGKHASQMSWDRHVYMVLSRYMMMNDLRRVR